MCVVLLPNVFHTNDMFALSEKSAEKKTKTGRLPIAHYKQKPAGSDLWPVNRCIPNNKWKIHTIKQSSDTIMYLSRLKENVQYNINLNTINLHINQTHPDLSAVMMQSAQKRCRHSLVVMVFFSMSRQMGHISSLCKLRGDTAISRPSVMAS